MPAHADVRVPFVRPADVRDVTEENLCDMPDLIVPVQSPESSPEASPVTTVVIPPLSPADLLSLSVSLSVQPNARTPQDARLPASAPATPLSPAPRRLRALSPSAVEDADEPARIHAVDDDDDADDAVLSVAAPSSPAPRPRPLLRARRPIQSRRPPHAEHAPRPRNLAIPGRDPLFAPRPSITRRPPSPPRVVRRVATPRTLPRPSPARPHVPRPLAPPPHAPAPRRAVALPLLMLCWAALWLYLATLHACMPLVLIACAAVLPRALLARPFGADPAEDITPDDAIRVEEADVSNTPPTVTPPRRGPRGNPPAVAHQSRTLTPMHLADRALDIEDELRPAPAWRPRPRRYYTFRPRPGGASPRAPPRHYPEGDDTDGDEDTDDEVAYRRAAHRVALMRRDFTGSDYDMLLQLDGEAGTSRRRPPAAGLSRAQISALPSYTYGGCTGAGGAAERCAVCLEEHEDDTLIRVLPCAHEFCACIDRWLATRASCPVCRAAVGSP